MVNQASDPEATQALKRQGARAAYTLGELMESRGLSGAQRWYQRSLELDPGGRFARRARRRLEVIGARPEAAQNTLARFERIKAEALKLGGDATRAAVQALRADAEPEAVFALELWLARDDLEVQRRPEASLQRTLAIGLAAANEVQAYTAYQLAFRAVGSRDPTPLIEALEAHLAQHTDHVRLRRLLHNARDLLWRIRARLGSWVMLAALLGLCVFRQGWRAFSGSTLRRWRPWRGASFIVYVFGAGGLIAELWSPGHLWPFWSCGVALVGVHLIVGASRHGRPTTGLGLHMALAVLSVTASLGACFMVLDTFGLQALMGM